MAGAVSPERITFSFKLLETFPKLSSMFTFISQLQPTEQKAKLGEYSRNVLYDCFHGLEYEFFTKISFLDI